MPKPKNKSELLTMSRQHFERLFALIDAMNEDKQNASFQSNTLNQNIRDVLWHLHYWHMLFINWYSIGMKNKKPDMPAKGYQWKDTPALNKEIQKKGQNTSLIESKQLLKHSFLQLQTIIEQHSNEELFEKKRYAWTGSTSLGAYLISNTSSHYEWAYRFIKKATQ